MFVGSSQVMMPTDCRLRCQKGVCDGVVIVYPATELTEVNEIAREKQEGEEAEEKSLGKMRF